MIADVWPWKILLDGGHVGKWMNSKRCSGFTGAGGVGDKDGSSEGCWVGDFSVGADVRSLSVSADVVALVGAGNGFLGGAAVGF